MTRQEFVTALEDQLGVAPGSLKEHQTLADLKAWDSMAAVLFMGLADEGLRRSVSSEEVGRAKTVADLLGLLDGAFAG